MRFGRRTNKFNVSPREKRTYNDVVYDSKIEMERAVFLDECVSSGAVDYWFRQVSFQLGPDTIYRVDFVVCGHAGDVVCEDVKAKNWAKISGMSKFRKTITLWKKYMVLPLYVVTQHGSHWRSENVNVATE